MYMYHGIIQSTILMHVYTCTIHVYAVHAYHHTLCTPSLPPSPSLTPSLPPSHQPPLFSYSAQDPMKFFMLAVKEGDWGDHSSPLQVPRSGTVQWVASANAISRPQLLDVLNSSVGTEQLIYLYAKVFYASDITIYMYMHTCTCSQLLHMHIHMYNIMYIHVHVQVTCGVLHTSTVRR